MSEKPRRARRQSPTRALERIRAARGHMRELTDEELLQAHDLLERLLNSNDLDDGELRRLQQLLDGSG